MKQGWEIKKLGEIICEHSVRNKQDYDYPVYSVTNSAGFCRDYFSKEVASKDKKTYKIVPKGYFAYNPSRINVGSVDWQRHEDNVIVSPLYVVFGTDDTICQDYLLYYLKSSSTMALIQNHATGTVRANLKFDILSQFAISLPPIAEQEKIVAELDCLSGIIEKKKQQLKELDNLAQSIFYEMFSNQDGTPVKLSQACSVVSGLVNPNDEPYCNYPHIGGANIESHTGKFLNVKLAKEENLISGKYPFDDTMILYSKIRPNLNKVALPSFKGICSADMYPLIPQNEFNKVFLKYILTQKVFLDYAISHSGRANIPKINREDLLNYEFLTYPITLQKEFASKIESIEKQKELIAQSIKETETLFNSRRNYYFN